MATPARTVGARKRSHPMLAQRKAKLSAVALASVLLTTAASAQQMFIYPQRGQTPEQQQRDRFECHQWAVQQTGFDPTMPMAMPPPAAPQPTSSPLGGA